MRHESAPGAPQARESKTRTTPFNVKRRICLRHFFIFIVFCSVNLMSWDFLSANVQWTFYVRIEKYFNYFDFTVLYGR